MLLYASYRMSKSDYILSCGDFYEMDSMVNKNDSSADFKKFASSWFLCSPHRSGFIVEKGEFSLKFFWKTSLQIAHSIFD